MIDCRRYTGHESEIIEPLSAALVACSSDGRYVFAAQGAELLTFVLERGQEELQLRQADSARAPGEIQQVTCHSTEPLVTLATRDAAAIYRLRAGRFYAFATLPVTPRQVLETQGGVFALMPPSPGRGPEILHLNGRNGEVEAVSAVSAAVATLRPAQGAAVIVVDPKGRTVRRVDLGDRCDPPNRRPGGSSRPPEPEEPSCKPVCCSGDLDHGSPSGGQRPEPPRRPPPDYCEEGSDGVENDCFVYIAAGFSIVCRNVCRPDREPCRRALHARVDRIELLDRTLFAVTRGGRTLEVLDPRSLVVEQQVALAGPGSLILAAPAAGQLIALAPDLSEVIVAQAAGAALDLDLDLQAEISEKVAFGTDFVDRPPGPLFALESKSVLILPIVDPGQNYSGPGNTTFREALTTLLTSPVSPDAPIPKISRYYDEQSNSQQVLTFTVFGADTTEFYTGGPIEIENALTSYFYGDFEPGGMVTIVNLGANPAEFRMRGNETRTITATSSINAQGGSAANEFQFTLDFPAAIVRIDLDGSGTISIPTSGPDWPILFEDSGGTPMRNLTLDPSTLSQNFTRSFSSAGVPFAAETAELRDALGEMLAASSAAADFEAIDVVWGKRPGETLGRIYILFRFAAGGSVPRFTNLASNAIISAFFGVAENDVRALAGSATFDISASEGDQAEAARLAQDYLTYVMRLAEIGEANEGAVLDPKLGSAAIQFGGSPDDVVVLTELRLTSAHGGGVAKIEPGGGSGGDPLRLATGGPLAGSDFPADSNNTMKDKAAFFEMLYGRIVTAVQNDLGGAPQNGWSALADFLNGFSTIYAVPVEPPPPSASSAWSVSGSASTPNLRAFVIGLGEPTYDPNGIGDPIQPRWGMNFNSFDPSAAPGQISQMESDTRTFAHELGHTLGLGDQYSSSKFDPTIEYIGSFDLMGSSQAEWPHFCAYHKLALGWWGPSDRLLISPPDEGVTDTVAFILVPTEWWRSGLTDAARSAVSNGAGLPVHGAAICDLGGDGGILATIEARTPGNEFSSSIAPASAAGQITVLNILDYGQSGRYGQVIADAQALPAEAVEGLLRFRRRIHKLRDGLQAGDTLNLAHSPGFPFEGLFIRVLEESSITIDGSTVPVYRCETEWTGGLAADVGFADNDEEWRSSDIAIDYVGNDPNNPESGERTWPDGEPLGVGEKVVIPPSGREPHRVLIRVRNFGIQTARNVTVDLFLRDPGGGGEIHGDTPYGTQIIPELLPVGDAGPSLLAFAWDVQAGQEPHVCWRAEVRDFEVGEGANAQVIVTDAAPTNNWAQQNIFETDVVYASPPETLLSKFSVYNDGPFVEFARLVPQGLPRGVVLRIRPRVLQVPAFSLRTFSLRFEFAEELIDDACRREMDVLLRCLRLEEHYEEPWGASLFKIRLKRKTACTIQGSWYGNNLELSGEVDPPIGVGRVSIRLDFANGEDAIWINAPLSPGGTFNAVFDTGETENNNKVIVAARYRGTSIFAPSTSTPVEIDRQVPVG